MRDKLVEGGYYLPLILAIIVVLLIGLSMKAQTTQASASTDAGKRTMSMSTVSPPRVCP